jgi:1,4-dihydroxy-2-naphthoate octaprenyltransferase
MVNYTTYANTSNVTGFAEAFDYSAGVVNSGIGYDAFGALMLGAIFLGFLVIGSKYTQERAFTFATFMTSIAAFIMVSGGVLNPYWMALPILGLIAAVYFANRVS